MRSRLLLVFVLVVLVGLVLGPATASAATVTRNPPGAGDWYTKPANIQFGSSDTTGWANRVVWFVYKEGVASPIYASPVWDYSGGSTYFNYGFDQVGNYTVVAKFIYHYVDPLRYVTADYIVDVGYTTFGVWTGYIGIVNLSWWFGIITITTTVPPVTPTPYSCESYDITGWVVDCDQPVIHTNVAGAKVFVLGHPELGVATTGADGCFNLGPAPAGTYTVVAVSGAKSAYADVTVPDVIPPCGDCLQMSICVQTGGPCPNAANSDQCCEQLTTSNYTLYGTLYAQHCVSNLSIHTTTSTTTQAQSGTTTKSSAPPLLVVAMAVFAAAGWAAWHRRGR